MAAAVTTNLPRRENEWHKEVRERQLQGKSIHGDGSFNSASQMGIEQFLLLRVLFAPPMKQSELCTPRQRRKWLSDTAFNDAKTSLNSQDSWRRYINQAKQQLSRDDSPDLGTYSLVQYYQSTVQGRIKSDEYSRPKIDFTPIAQRTRQALASQTPFPVTPTPLSRRKPSTDFLLSEMFQSVGIESQAPPSTGPSWSLSIPEMLSPVSPLRGDAAAHFQAVEDEQIVNTALILFLNALTMHCKQVQAEWTLHRRRFVLGSDGKDVYEARVDGYFRTRQNEVRAIVEVKPFLRYRKHDAIRMQEAGQVAAWISNHPPNVEKLRRENRKAR
jgi:hypothetical protein